MPWRNRIDVDSADGALLERDRTPGSGKASRELADVRFVPHERDARAARVLVQIAEHVVVGAFRCKRIGDDDGRG